MNTNIASSTPFSVSRRAPSLALGLIACFIFASVFDWFVVSGIHFARNPASIMGLLLLITFVFGFASRSMVSVSPPQAWLFCFVGLAAFIQAFSLADPASGGILRTLMRFAQWLQVILLYWIFTEFLKDRRVLGVIGVSFVATTVFMVVSVLLQVPGLISPRTDRLGFYGINLNLEAWWYAVGLLVLIWMLIERWPGFRRIDLVIAGCALVLLVGLLNAASRGGFIYFLASFSVLLSVSLRKRNMAAYVYLVPIVIGLGAFFVLNFGEGIIGRFEAAATGEDDGGRLIIFESAWTLVQKQPVIGYGTAYLSHLGDYARPDGRISAHNAYFHVALTFGVPALLIWLGFVGSLLLRCYRYSSSPVGALMFALVAGTLAHGLVSNLLFDKYYWIMLAVATQVPRFSNLFRQRSNRWLQELGLNRKGPPVSRPVEPPPLSFEQGRWQRK